MKLLFASTNVNKLNEIRKLLPEGYTLLSLTEVKYFKELEETAVTLEGNALQKARFIFEKFKINCFADDSGLEVEGLGGRPGVHSAYFAGLPRNDKMNILQLLAELENIENRKARFRTVIALIIDGKEVLFEGILNGCISLKPKGTNGFGYDPVFIPFGNDKTLAEMTMDEKNIISHRSQAIRLLLTFFMNLNS